MARVQTRKPKDKGLSDSFIMQDVGFDSDDFIMSKDIGTTEIESKTVGTTEIESKTVGTTEIESKTVGTTEIESKTVGTTEIEARSVSRNKIKRLEEELDKLKKKSKLTKDAQRIIAAIKSESLIQETSSPVIGYKKMTSRTAEGYHVHPNYFRKALTELESKEIIERKEIRYAGLVKTYQWKIIEG